MSYVISFLLLIGWLVGLVLAQGFWSTFFALIFPLWGYYLVVEHIVIKYWM
jgi:hypothetical protein